MKKKLFENLIRSAFIFCCSLTLGVTMLGWINPHSAIASPATVKNLEGIADSTISVTGKITNDNGESLPGVSIRVKESSIGTVSNLDGFYRIDVPSKASILVFSYIGLETLEKNVIDNTIINVVLKEQASSLSEVVVIGYGEVKRADLTGSVGEVNVADMQKAPVPAIDQALAGRVAGVNVGANDGQPGSGMNIVVRGGNSLTQSNDPLYVIDGFPLENPSLASLNPDDIVSINILKDASATAIYGSRGANGVIVIETRQGKAGKTSVIYNASAGFLENKNTMEPMSPYEFVKFQLERFQQVEHVYLPNNDSNIEDYRDIEGVNFQDYLFRKAPQHSHNLTVSGGNVQTKFVFSGSFVDQDGIMLNSGYKRAQARLTLAHDINPKLKVGINTYFTNELNYGQITSSPQSTSFPYSAYTMFHTWGYRPVAGFGEEFDILHDLTDAEAIDMRINPIISVKNEIRNQGLNTLFTNAFAKYTIVPGLDFTFRVGVNLKDQVNEAFYNSKTGRGFDHVNNTKGVNGRINNTRFTDWANENFLNYKKTVGIKHEFNGVLGFTAQDKSLMQNGYEATHVPNEELGLSGLDDGVAADIMLQETRSTLVSLLSRVNYTFNKKYLFTASVRADASSKFSKANRWGYFPSGAFAWRISEESFLKHNTVISDAKLRTSYGLTGNNRIGDYSRFSSMTLPYSAYYSFDNQLPASGIAPNSFGNAALKWETTAQADIGLDIGFLNNRIRTTIDVYRKITTDLLLNANVPRTSGHSKIFKNVGKIQNQGLEITISTRNIEKRKFKWSTDFNISFNNNKVLALAEDEESIQSAVSWSGAGDYNSTFLYIAKLGGPASAFYGLIWEGNYQYADFNAASPGEYLLKPGVPTNGTARELIQPGDIKYRDVNGDGIVNEFDRVLIGRTLPIHFGGLNNNLSYGNFDLNVFFQWRYGNNIYNGNRLIFEGNGLQLIGLNQFASYEDRWTPDNQSSLNYRNGGQGPLGIYSTRTIEDGSFLRLKTLSLSYRLPKKFASKLGMSGLQLTASGQNLITWTKYSGMDPEVSVRNSALTPGFDYSAYPMARSYIFGLKVEL